MRLRELLHYRMALIEPEDVVLLDCVSCECVAREEIFGVPVCEFHNAYPDNKRCTQCEAWRHDEGRIFGNRDGTYGVLK